MDPKKDMAGIPVKNSLTADRLVYFINTIFLTDEELSKSNFIK